MSDVTVTLFLDKPVKLLRIKKDVLRGAVAKTRLRQSPKSKESSPTIWIGHAHRANDKRCIVRTGEKLTAFLKLETATQR